MNSRYDFRLKLLKKTLAYWSRDKFSKVNLLMMIAYVPTAGLNIFFFLSSDKLSKWVNLAAAIFLIITFYMLHRRYLITILRIITGRCVRDIAALKFELAVNNSIKYSDIMCPICNSRMAIHPSLGLFMNLVFMSGDGPARVGLLCHFCGFEFEMKS